MSIRSLMPSLWTDDANKDVFQDLQSEVDRAFRQFHSASPLALNGGVYEGDFVAFVPRINVAENENKIEVKNSESA